MAALELAHLQRRLEAFDALGQIGLELLLVEAMASATSLVPENFSWRSSIAASVMAFSLMSFAKHLSGQGCVTALPSVMPVKPGRDNRTLFRAATARQPMSRRQKPPGQSIRSTACRRALAPRRRRCPAR